MPLVPCQDCGREVSTSAPTCPQCGRPGPFRAAPPPRDASADATATVVAATEATGSGLAVVSVTILALLVAAILFAAISNESPTNSATEQRVVDSVKAQISLLEDSSRRMRANWQYSSYDDAMSGKPYRLAQKLSDNEVEFSSPYGEPQRAMLSLRSHPRYGKDVIFRIQRGQLLCRPIGECTVLVRFDEGPALQYTVVEPGDNSSESLFIQNYARFVRGMVGAKKVRISVPVYQEGEPAFTFDASGFDPKKYSGQ